MGFRFWQQFLFAWCNKQPNTFPLDPKKSFMQVLVIVFRLQKSRIHDWDSALWSRIHTSAGQSRNYSSCKGYLLNSGTCARSREQQSRYSWTHSWDISSTSVPIPPRSSTHSAGYSEYKMLELFSSEGWRVRLLVHAWLSLNKISTTRNIVLFHLVLMCKLWTTTPKQMTRLLHTLDCIYLRHSLNTQGWSSIVAFAHWSRNYLWSSYPCSHHPKCDWSGA